MFGLIVDPYPIYAEALRDIVRTSLTEATVPIAPTLDQGQAHIPPEAAMRLVVLFIEPSAGLASLERVRTSWPNAPVLTLTDRFDMGLLREAMRLGARGMITRAATRPEIQSAVTKVMRGALHVPDDFEAAAPARPPGFAGLTPRQMDVLKAMANGRANREIAQELGIALATVKLHVNAVLRALKARNRTEAAAMAIRAGLGGHAVTGTAGIAPPVESNTDSSSDSTEADTTPPPYEARAAVSCS